MLSGIAARAIIPVAVAVTGFVVLGCLLLHSFIKGDLVADTIRHEVGMADTIVKSTRYAMLENDRDMLQQSLFDIGSQQGVEHVRIFNKKGIVMFSSDPGEINRGVNKQAAGCNGCHDRPRPATRLGTMEQSRRFTNAHGSEVLAVMTPIYNEPSCAVADCHRPVADNELLGTLDIGFSMTPLLGSLSQLRMRLMVFCTMILFLAVGGVCALLRRTVLLPVRQLALFSQEMAAGKVDRRSPEGSEEIETIAAVLRYQALELQQERSEKKPGRDKKLD
jgi:HAMP domain-containing protein